MIELSNTLYGMLEEILDDSKVAQAMFARMTESDDMQYVGYGSGNLTFLQSDDIATLDADDDVWTSPLRRTAKAGRLARQMIRQDLVDLELTDQDFEIFANKIKAADITESGQYELVSGEDIVKWYNGRTYVNRNNGSLERSCMRYDECGKFFTVYVKNPDVVKMLILVNRETQKLHGRALVWFTDDQIIMDRIYGNDSIVAAFQQYAARQGWLFRRHNRYTHEREFVEKTKSISISKTIPLTNLKTKYYPYMDTFKYINKEEGWVSNDSNTNWDHQLTNQHGQAIPR